MTYTVDMDIQGLTESFFNDVKLALTEPNTFRAVLIFLASIVVAYWLSKFLAEGIVWVAHKVGSRGDEETNEQRALRYRQVETYLSIAVALIRVIVVSIVGFITWRLLSPLATENQAANGIAAIGAGTIFVLFAGQTLGIILRDLTAGSIMITEGWFHVGDHIQIEPYAHLSGVVERFTLRSTRLRALNGEVIWVHNQNITGVRVTPRGVRTISVEIFTKDKKRGEMAIQDMIDAIPRGKTMLAQPLKIETSEAWTNNSWHFTVTGQTAPGREWLIESYFFESIVALDEHKKATEKILTYPPMVHMSDSTADRRFKRAVRVQSGR